MTFTKEEIADIQQRAAEASAMCRPSPDYQTERLKRCLHKMDTEPNDLLRPDDPRNLPPQPPLTKSQEGDWRLVMNVVFPTGK